MAGPTKAFRSNSRSASVAPTSDQPRSECRGESLVLRPGEFHPAVPSSALFSHRHKLSGVVQLADSTLVVPGLFAHNAHTAVMENVEYLQAPVDGKEPRRVVVLNYSDLVQPNVPKISIWDFCSLID